MKKKLPSRFVHARLTWTVCFLFSLLFNLSVLRSGEAQQLLKDVNEAPDLYEQEYSHFAGLGDELIFVSQGSKLYTSQMNSGVEETRLIHTFTSPIYELIVVGDIAYFNAGETATGSELWKTDGTAEGTVLVKDIYPGTSSSNPLQLTNSDGVLYFVSSDKAGKELWRSDGTATGTYMVKDIFPKSGSSNPSFITSAGNGNVYFSANDGSHGYELWKSNGTSDGTTLVKDIRTETKASSSPEALAYTNGKLFFVANDNIHGKELWMSDGSEAGTYLVKDIRAGSNTSAIKNTIGINGICYFTGTDAIHGQELWRSDGTEAGTYLLKDMTPGSAGSNGEQPFSHMMGNFTNINGLLFFTAYGGNLYYIWKSDGTTEGTVPIQRSNGPGISTPKPTFRVKGNDVYYFNDPNDEYYNYSLWKMSTTGTNLTPVFSFFMDGYDTYYPGLAITNEHMYFFARPSEFDGFKIYISDGSPSGTKQLGTDTYQGTESSYPDRFTKVNDRLVFTTTVNYWEQTLYSTDGTPGNTKELVTMSDGANFLKKIGSKLYASSSGVFELIETDGTPEGTRSLAWDWSQPGAQSLEMVNGKFYYHNLNGQVWMLDPAAPTPALIKDAYFIQAIAPVNGALSFRVITEQNGDELWRTNGTSSGTYRVKTIRSQRATTNYEYPSATIKNTHFFIANDGFHGNELWRTQGSAASTYMVTDLNPNDGAFLKYNYYEYDIASMVAFRDSLYLSAVDAGGTWSLFKTNGTATGMKKVKDVNSVLRMIPAGNKLFLLVQSKQVPENFELWVTDGTSNGTKFLKDLGRYYWSMDDYHVEGGILYFTTKYDQYLWRTDGTVCGTQQFSVNTTTTGEFNIVNNKIVFSGSGNQVGFEPFAYPMNEIILQPCDQAIAANGFGDATIVGGEKLVMQSPNPFQSDFALRISGDENESVHVHVYSSSGQPVQSFQDLMCNTDYRLGAQWASGMYILKIVRNGQVLTEKVIKQR